MAEQIVGIDIIHQAGSQNIQFRPLVGAALKIFREHIEGCGRIVSPQRQSTVHVGNHQFDWRSIDFEGMYCAVGVNDEGYREILGVAEGSREDKESWSNFLRYLKERGLKGVRLVISDKCIGLYEVLGDFFPEAKW